MSAAPLIEGEQPPAVGDNPAAAAPGMGEAWAAFGDGRGPWWLKLLKPGFRHCFVVLGDARRWVVIDPASCFTDVAALDRAEHPDLPHRLRAQGYTVVPAPLRRQAVPPAPWRPFTCVEAVKRVLGLDAPDIFTPWGLYRHLKGIHSYD